MRGSTSPSAGLPSIGVTTKSTPRRSSRRSRASAITLIRSRPERADADESAQAKWLMKCLAVAGFAAMNVMLLSVSVWAGNVSDMTQETRDLFHWLSALIALPAAAYAGQPFFQSAFRALRARHVNMDVPISIGVTLGARPLGVRNRDPRHACVFRFRDHAVVLPARAAATSIWRCGARRGCSPAISPA